MSSIVRDMLRIVVGRRAPCRGGAALLSLVVLLFSSSAVVAFGAAPGDTVISVFNREPIHFARRVVVARERFPDLSRKYRRIIMTYSLECPRGGCDPWDRGGQVWVADHDTSKAALNDYVHWFFHAPRVQIGRFVTPYGKGATWKIDVTDYRALLADSATIISYITTFTGKGQGYLLTMSFEFIAGSPDFEPVGYRNLWVGKPLYGNPDTPIEEFLRPIRLTADREAEFTKVRVIASGHGQGNTDNAGEFARKWHELVVDETLRFRHYLWRNDCGELAGLQYGTWDESRAGFCPGQVIEPWDNDISSHVEPGAEFTVDYNVEPYENRCRPGVDPCPCENCDYDGLGHTKPTIEMESQVIYYRGTRSDPGAEALFRVDHAEMPDVFRITPRLEKPTEIQVEVVDVMRNTIFHQVRRDVTTGAFGISLKTTPGVYMLAIRMKQGTFRKRIVVR
jgi:hypothetical protein